jgi:hypothetical protein
VVRPLLTLLVSVGVAFASTAAAAPTAAPTAARLLARHAPVLVLHPAEQVRPASVDGFLAASDIQRRGAAGWEATGGVLPVEGADHRLDQRLCRAADGPAATSCYIAAQATHGSRPVVYGAAFRARDRIELQYWIWYPWDPYSPTVPPGELWQVHEGDWEAVAVILDRAAKPLVVGYSQHGEGVRRSWKTAPKRGLRPIAYVALGSHANYPTVGTHRFDPRVVDPLFISIIRQNRHEPVDHTGRGATVVPALLPVSATAPAWMTFAGGWGEDSYLRVPGGEPTAYGATGPRGPAFHEQWRAPVAEVLSWPKG